MLYRLRDQTLTPRARRSREGRRRIAGGFAVSLLLHTVILAALLVRLKWEPEPELLPPPATVSMVFEGGRPQGPSAPEPTPLPGSAIEQTAPTQSEAPPAQPGTPPPLPEATPQPPARPPPPTVQRETPTPPEPPPPVRTAPPTPQPSTPVEPEPSEVTVPPPQPVTPPTAPPIPQRKPPTPANPSLPQTWPPIRQAAPATRPSDFPAPMDFSLGAPPAKSGALAMGKPLLSLTLPHRGPGDPTPYSFETDAEVGTDCRNLLSQWVESHSYYPSQAAEMNQQGTARVLVTALPNGQVTSVELERGSGS
ncbi:MAG TPA: TonB family protein, partial [Acetobacteraceae bacterium]|nr:TonB family protein [Acetobacteraceae bacterium]